MPTKKSVKNKVKSNSSSLDLVFLGKDQIRGIKEEITFLKKMLDEDATRGNHKKISDPDRIKREMREKKELLETHTPVKLKGTKANKAYKELEEISEKLKESMLSGKQFNQMYPKSSGSELDFERAIKQQVEFQTNPKLVRMQNRFKYLASKIDPDDPIMSNVERLRK